LGTSDLVRDAWLFGIDVQERGARSDQRTIGFGPYLQRLTDRVGGDPSGLRLVAARCRERAALLVSAGADPRSRRVVGYVGAAALLDAAAAAPSGAPCLGGSGESDRGRWGAAMALRRLTPRWWLRRRATSPGRLVYHLADRARDVSAAQVVVRGAPVATVRYQVCPRCEVAAVVGLEVDPDVRGVGLGTRLVAAAVRSAPDRTYQWHTVDAPDATRGFWRSAAHRLRLDFSHVDRVPCAHMR
jgi:hypothetical protein